MIQYATEKSHSYTNLSYQILNIFSSEFKEMKFDIITINSFCHHLDNVTLISLYRQLTMQTHFAIIINDLHRHWISYYVFKGLAKIFNFSYLTKHDGSLSILRAFRKQELLDLLQSANINLYQIRWRWPFRWEIIIWLCG
jgi:2-polyprenyl-3-methyl-5-hydroxy-6-metoxy-1,4-benzoquinol methylase